MKKFFQKLKNNKFGFSLVELIVVIAIMAVIAAVLVPSLLRHVEESRAEKDVKTTDEVVTAVELALADQDVYDELVEHSVFDNVSCYVDKTSEADYQKVIIKESYNQNVEQYKFDDNARLLDEVPYYGAGNMRGLTITFSPEKDSNESSYDLSRGIINRFVGRKTGYLYENEKLYNAIRSVVGDKIYNSSQTYRNSDFTIFIRLGSAGGNEAGNQDATEVWGQYNGTNLPADTIKTAKITEDRNIGDAGQYDASVNEYINDEENINIDFSQLAAMGGNGFGEELENMKALEASNKAIEELSKTYEFKYYSTLKLALVDANNNNIGSQSDSTKEDAEAAVYLNESGRINVVLLKSLNYNSHITLGNGIYFNLGGKTINFELTDGKNMAVEISGSKLVTIDGRLAGSVISATQQKDVNLNMIANFAGTNLEFVGGKCIAKENKNTTVKKTIRAFYTFANSNLTIKDATVYTSSDITSLQSICNNGNTNIQNSTIETVSKEYANGILNIGTLKMNNSTMLSKSNTSNAFCVYNKSTVSMELNNSEFKAYCLNGEYSCFGVWNTNEESSNSTFNNCVMYGTQAGLGSYVGVNINGGVYEGTAWGGVYLTAANSVSYVKNATFNCVDVPSWCTSPGTKEMAFAQGGNSKENATVYFDNCIFNASKYALVLRNNGNKAYISNSNIADGTIVKMNDYTSTAHVYLGKGNGFDITNVDPQERVTITDEEYVQN